MTQDHGQRPAADARFLDSSSEMAALIRAHDWASTSLGPISSWPQSLRTTVSLCLASNFPINIVWGPDRIQIYNDGYRVLCGDRHPATLGMDYRVCWESAWAALAAPFDCAVRGETSYLENQRMFLFRNGYLEETFFTFSLSPIRDESGEIGGLFHPVTETTLTMLGARRTRAVRDLTAQLAPLQTGEQVFAQTAVTPKQFEFDLPFVLLYEFDAETGDYVLRQRSGIEASPLVAPERLLAGAFTASATGDAAGAAAGFWPLAQLLQSAAEPRVLELPGLRQALGDAPCGPYPDGPDLALAIPVMRPGATQPVALLLTAASARLPFSADYRGFYELLGATLGTALARVAAHEEERKRLTMLAEIDHAKTVFFSNVSHEFRTPLTLMLGPLEDLLAMPDVTAPQQVLLATANRNARRLLKLVNALLDFSRMEMGRTSATFEATDLATDTAELASHFASACERAGLSLGIDCQPLPAPVWIDRDMWEKIVFNLLSNAFKFTLEGGISVRLRAVDGMAELVVADTGVGIPRAELGRVFERFHRIEGQPGRSVEGTGIGLALVHEMVLLHDGEISAESEAGRGALFRVRIPMVARSAAPVTHRQPSARRHVHAPVYLSEAAQWIDSGAHTGPDAPQRQHVSGHIVLADDNNDMRRYVQKTLTDAGYLVTACVNGAQALERLRSGDLPDLVVSDVMMPLVDGFALLSEVRSESRMRELPFILLSARAGEEARIEGLAAGADDYIVKPFSGRELLARVEGAISLARLRREGGERDSELRLRIEADRNKDEFLAMLAHELRNPLAPISAAAELMGLGLLDADRLQRTSGIITRQVRHMTALVDDLLDVSRVTRGLVEIERQPLDLQLVVAAAVEQTRPLITGRGHELALHLPAGPVLVLGDYKRLVQVLANLLNNAAKFTPSGGAIVVALAVSEDRVRLSVRDNGIGIAAELTDRIFDLFAQATHTPDRSQGGLGLGLALARKLTELHGGSIGFVSAGAGAGTQFTVELPAYGGLAQLARDDAPAGAAGAGQRLRVLLVDDNVDAASMLAMLLEAQGYLVQVEHDASAALARAAAWAPAVCILDIGLPDMDGNALARELRRRPEGRDATLIAVTGYGEERDREAGFAAGFDAYFAKPVDTDRLHEVLEHAARVFMAR